MFIAIILALCCVGCTCTVLIQIVATAIINFSLARVRLLIEDSSYSRAAFIDFGWISHSAISKNSNINYEDLLQVIDM